MAIRVPEVRLIDENDQMIGIINTDEARHRAEDAGMDLVEVAPDSDPPVCRIVEYGRFKYELSKKLRQNKAQSRGHEMKEVRLGRSMKIDPHDVAIRINQARKFLIDGHKVQIVQNFRGREMMYRERGNERMAGIIEQLDEVSKVETPPRMFGRRMSMILAPDKVKIAQYKRKHEASKPKTESTVPPDSQDSQAPPETPKPQDTPVTPQVSSGADSE